jgi:hypothetical protein
VAAAASPLTPAVPADALRMFLSLHHILPLLLLLLLLLLLTSP